MVSHKLARRQAHRPQDERGQVIVLMVLMMVVLLGFAALVVDVGYAYYAHRSLQSSADAAALAGSQELPDAAQAAAVARQYSSSAGNKNNKSNINNVTTTVTTKCVVSLGGCVPGTSSNAVVVLEMAPTKTFFAGLLGIPSFTIKAKATAAMRGGTPKPAHVMIVLDRTGSMGYGLHDRRDQARLREERAQGLPRRHGPGVRQGRARRVCPAQRTMCATPRRPRTGPPTDYDVVHEQLSLRAALDRLQDVGHVAARSRPRRSCPRSTASRPAAPPSSRPRSTRRATTLAANHDPEAQDVIIFMTDGEANYGACASPNGSGVCSNNTSPYRTNPCGQAVTSARPGRRGGRLGLRNRLRHSGCRVLGLEVHRHRHRRCLVRHRRRQPVRLPGVAGDHRQRRPEGDCLRSTPR